MTARVPTPGGDDGDWGTILNAFLEVSHNGDGTLQSSAIQQAGAVTIVNGKTASNGSITLAASDVGAPTALAGDNDVSISSPSNNQVLTYDSTTSKWTNQVAPSAPVTSVFSRNGVVSAQSGDYTFSQVGATQGLIPTAVKTSAYTANPGDFVPVDASGSSVTITLPTAPADKSRVEIKMINTSGANTVTIDTGGSDVFNKSGGTTSGTLSLLNQALMIQYTASSSIWYVQSDDLPLTQLDGRYASLSGAAFTGEVSPAIVSLTDAATIAINAALGNDFRVTLTGNHTLGNPTNSVNGQKIIFQVTQDGTGSRVLTYGSAYEFSTGLPQPTLSTGAGITDVLGFVYNSTKSKWLLLAFVNGFS